MASSSPKGKGKNLKDFQEEPWYFGSISPKVARCLLITEPTGTFLIRLAKFQDSEYLILSISNHSDIAESFIAKVQDNKITDVSLRFPPCKHKKFPNEEEMLKNMSGTVLSNWHPYPNTPLVKPCPAQSVMFYEFVESLEDSDIHPDSKALLDLKLKEEIISDEVNYFYPGYVGFIDDDEGLNDVLQASGEGTWAFYTKHFKQMNKNQGISTLGYEFAIVGDGEVRRVQMKSVPGLGVHWDLIDGKVRQRHGGGLKDKIIRIIAEFPSVKPYFRFVNSLAMRCPDFYKVFDEDVIMTMIPENEIGRLYTLCRDSCENHTDFTYLRVTQTGLLHLAIKVKHIVKILPILANPQGLFLASRLDVKGQTLVDLFEKLRANPVDRRTNYTLQLGNDMGICNLPMFQNHPMDAE